jgi:calcium-activated chloride channel regulator 3/4
VYIKKGIYFNYLKEKDLKNTFKNYLKTAVIALLSATLFFSNLNIFAEIPLESDAEVFDIVISLHSDPQTDADKAPYEEMLGHFADTVYESTNGAHKIGKIRIYRDSRVSGYADILWEANGGPAAWPGGIGVVNKDINMYDVFGITNYHNAANRDDAGFTLGHEWGHYAYKMYDEYSSNKGGGWQPDSADDEPRFAIMNDQWQGEDPRWLNFTIDSLKDATTGAVLVNEDFRDTENTANHRVYLAGGWEVLSRNRNNDPATAASGAHAQRIYYTTLAGAVPPRGTDDDGDGDNEMVEPTIEMPGDQADARSELEIIWMSEEIVYQLVLDKSNSMNAEGGVKIDNVIEAAKNWVDAVPAGETSIGLITFNENVEVLHEIIAVEDDDDKTTLKDAIDGITAEGTTAMGDAAQTAITNLLAATDETVTRVVILLSDGLNNEGTDPLDDAVLDPYKENQIPLFTFAYGDSADYDVLREMANQTRGEYAESAVSLAEITALFNQSRRGITAIPGIAQSDLPLAGGGTGESDFYVDSSVDRLFMTVVYDGGVSDVSISLLAPTGTLYPADTVSSRGDSTLCSFSLDNPVAGNWALHLQSNITEALDVSISIEADTRGETAYTLALTNLTGETITYPEPLIIAASLKKSAHIANAEITGTVVCPDGSTVPLQFFDNGESPDEIANDGMYSAEFTGYSGDGIYTINALATNNGGNAFYTMRGKSIQRNPDGTDYIYPENPVAGNFQRSDFIQVEVTGVRSDDHGNNFADATDIVADNTRYPGIIETAGDVDCFRITVPSPAEDPVQVRITGCSSAMDPFLTVYREDGTLISGSQFITDTTYPYVSFSPNGQTIFYAIATHQDSAGTGYYTISAGHNIGSDRIGLPALYASDTLTVGDRTQIVSGSIFTGSNFVPGSEIKIYGNLAVDGNAEFTNRSVLTGTIKTAGTITLTNGAEIIGKDVQNTTVTPYTIPTQPVIAGTTPVTVNHDTVDSIQSGSYGAILVKSRGVLHIGPGIYNIASLELEPDAKLMLNTTNGDIHFNVAGTVTLGDRTSFIKSKNHKVIFYTNSSGTIRIGNDTAVKATIIAPEARILISARNTLTEGSIAAKHIIFEQDAMFKED